MALAVFSSQIRPPTTQSVTLVLDASESADPCWDQIVTLAGALLSKLPSESVEGLFFLGNPAPCNPALLPTMQHNWREANRSRASLITPIFESLSDKPETRMLIIGSGCIFDLEDWKGTPLLRRTLLVSLGDSLQGGKEVADELLNPSCDEVLRCLHDPVQVVELQGRGFMPLEWDNRDYQLTLECGKAVLRAKRARDYALQLRFLARKPFHVVARFTHVSGQILEVAITPAPSSPAPPIPLSAEESVVLRQAIQRQPFRCPHCAKQHDWHILHCLESASILGELIYPSLRDSCTGGYAVFHLTSNGASCRIHQGDVLPLSGDRVAIRDGGQARIYCYDARADTWNPEDQILQPYHEIGEGEYAILL